MSESLPLEAACIPSPVFHVAPLKQWGVESLLLSLTASSVASHQASSGVVKRPGQFMVSKGGWGGDSDF